MVRRFESTAASCHMPSSRMRHQPARLIASRLKENKVPHRAWTMHNLLLFALAPSLLCVTTQRVSFDHHPISCDIPAVIYPSTSCFHRCTLCHSPTSSCPSSRRRKQTSRLERKVILYYEIEAVLSQRETAFQRHFSESWPAP